MGTAAQDRLSGDPLGSRFELLAHLLMRLFHEESNYELRSEIQLSEFVETDYLVAPTYSPLEVDDQHKPAGGKEDKIHFLADQCLIKRYSQYLQAVYDTGNDDFFSKVKEKLIGCRKSIVMSRLRNEIFSKYGICDTDEEPEERILEKIGFHDVERIGVTLPYLIDTLSRQARRHPFDPTHSLVYLERFLKLYLYLLIMITLNQDDRWKYYRLLQGEPDKEKLEGRMRWEEYTGKINSKINLTNCFNQLLHKSMGPLLDAMIVYTQRIQFLTEVRFRLEQLIAGRLEMIQLEERSVCQLNELRNAIAHDKSGPVRLEIKIEDFAKLLKGFCSVFKCLQLPTLARIRRVVWDTGSMVVELENFEQKISRTSMIHNHRLLDLVGLIVFYSREDSRWLSSPLVMPVPLNLYRSI